MKVIIMPIVVEWSPEPNVRWSRLTGDITTDEVIAWSEDELNIVQNQPQVVHFITELGTEGHMRANMLKVPTVIEWARHPHTGWLVLVGGNALASMLVEMLHRIAGLKFKVCSDVDVARDFLLKIVDIDAQKVRDIESGTNHLEGGR